MAWSCWATRTRCTRTPCASSTPGAASLAPSTSCSATPPPCCTTPPSSSCPGSCGRRRARMTPSRRRAAPTPPSPRGSCSAVASSTAATSTWRCTGRGPRCTAYTSAGHGRSTPERCTLGARSRRSCSRGGGWRGAGTSRSRRCTTASSTALAPAARPAGGWRGAARCPRTTSTRTASPTSFRGASGYPKCNNTGASI
uniref:Uncharacterized protein n=1 Tax=Arundo donax TaxID=35708 RepID=A0A0A9DMQ7_ARUDO